ETSRPNESDLPRRAFARRMTSTAAFHRSAAGSAAFEACSASSASFSGSVASGRQSPDAQPSAEVATGTLGEGEGESGGAAFGGIMGDRPIDDATAGAGGLGAGAGAAGTGFGGGAGAWGAGSGAKVRGSGATPCRSGRLQLHSGRRTTRQLLDPRDEVRQRARRRELHGLEQRHLEREPRLRRAIDLPLRAV